MREWWETARVKICCLSPPTEATTRTVRRNGEQNRQSKREKSNGVKVRVTAIEVGERGMWNDKGSDAKYQRAYDTSQPFIQIFTAKIVKSPTLKWILGRIVWFSLWYGYVNLFDEYNRATETRSVSFWGGKQRTHVLQTHNQTWSMHKHNRHDGISLVGTLLRSSVRVSPPTVYC